MATKRKQAPTRKAAKPAERIAVVNPLHPETKRTVDARMYRAVRRAILKVVPRRAPGLTEPEFFEKVRGQLPEELFPGGAKAGWWTKTVQLDLEARRLLERVKLDRLHWRRIGR